jgi:hypothetical protein
MEIDGRVTRKPLRHFGDLTESYRCVVDLWRSSRDAHGQVCRVSVANRPTPPTETPLILRLFDDYPLISGVSLSEMGLSCDFDQNRKHHVPPNGRESLSLALRSCSQYTLHCDHLCVSFLPYPLQVLPHSPLHLSKMSWPR